MVNDLSKMLQRLLGEHRRAGFTTAGTAPVQADTGMIEQVIMNLAVNARDAMPEAAC